MVLMEIIHVNDLVYFFMLVCDDNCNCSYLFTYIRKENVIKKDILYYQKYL